MPYCSECGKEIQRGVKFCPECGASQNKAGQPVAARGTAPPPKPKDWGSLRALSALDVILGISLVALGGLSLVSTVSPSALALTVGILFIGGGSGLVSGYSILRQKSWARAAGTLTGIVGILIGVLLLSTSNAALLLLGLGELVSGVGSLYLFGFRRRMSSAAIMTQ